MTIINAFHPDYVKTYMPHLLTSIKLEATQVQNGKVNGAKSKATREATGSTTVNSINAFPKTKPRSKK